MSSFLDDDSIHIPNLNTNHDSILDESTSAFDSRRVDSYSQVSDNIPSFGSSRVSSPEVPNTALFNNLRVQSVDNDSAVHNDYESHTEEMEKSILSLKKSLANMRMNASTTDDMKEHAEQTRVDDTTFDSSRFDETQQQFNRDIHLDKNDTMSKISLPSTTKSTTFTSPWRKLRYTPAVPSTHLTLPTIAPLKVGSMDLKAGTATLDASSNVETISELNKQLTSYKMQIRFFKQFLQKLIEENNGLNVNDLTQLRDSLSPIKKGTNLSDTSDQEIKQDLTSSKEYSQLRQEYNNLSESYDEIFKLNEDLYVSLENFQAKLEEKDFQVDNLRQSLQGSLITVNSIIRTLLNDPHTDVVSQKILTRCLADTPEMDLDSKLETIQLELKKRLKSATRSGESERASFTSSSSITVVDREKQFEINNYIKTIHQLMSTLEQLRNEFNDQNKLVDKMKKELDMEVEQSEQLRANNTMMKQSLDNISDIIDQTVNMSNTRELENLKQENQKLTRMNATMNKKFEEYQSVIDNLQREVNDIQTINRHDPNMSELNEELLQSHRDFNKLQEEFNLLHEQYVKLKEDSSNTVSSLTNQLHSKKQETSSLRAEKILAERLQQELNISVEKQRTLKAEKIRLTYKVETLSKDKIALQTTIQNLTDKVTDLTVTDSQNSKILESDNSLGANRKINILEYQLAELLLYDTFKFQKLLKSFNKIADDASLKEPTRKIEFMNKKFIPNNSSGESQTQDMDFTDMATIKEYHKSIFDYFSRAVDVVVNDHVKLLLKESEESSRSSDYVNKLHKRIDELNRINDEVSNLFDSMDKSGNLIVVDGAASPRARLRIEELTSRWKAEREARVYESNEAEARLKELELENERLRLQLT